MYFHLDLTNTDYIFMIANIDLIIIIYIITNMYLIIIIDNNQYSNFN